MQRVLAEQAVKGSAISGERFNTCTTSTLLKVKSKPALKTLNYDFQATPVINFRRTSCPLFDKLKRPIFRLNNQLLCKSI